MSHEITNGVCVFFFFEKETYIIMKRSERIERSRSFSKRLHLKLRRAMAIRAPSLKAERLVVDVQRLERLGSKNGAQLLWMEQGNDKDQMPESAHETARPGEGGEKQLAADTCCQQVNTGGRREMGEEHCDELEERSEEQLCGEIRIGIGVGSGEGSGSGVGSGVGIGIGE